MIIIKARWELLVVHVVKKSPSIAGYAGLNLCGRTKIPHAVGQLSSSKVCTSTTEPGF